MRFPLHKTAIVSSSSDFFSRLDLTTQTQVPIGPHHPGAFAVSRRHHIHEGVDLYAQAGDEVIAMEPGVVVAFGPFTGPAANMPWWRDTEFVMVEGGSGVLCYGEIRVEASLRVGATVTEGQRLGQIATVLRHDKGRPSNMLHLERYMPGVRASCGLWPLDTEHPAGLLDPTPLLLQAAVSV